MTKLNEICWSKIQSAKCDGFPLECETQIWQETDCDALSLFYISCLSVDLLRKLRRICKCYYKIIFKCLSETMSSVWVVNVLKVCVPKRKTKKKKIRWVHKKKGQCVAHFCFIVLGLVCVYICYVHCTISLLYTFFCLSVRSVRLN